MTTKKIGDFGIGHHIVVSGDAVGFRTTTTRGLLAQDGRRQHCSSRAAAPRSRHLQALENVAILVFQTGSQRDHDRTASFCYFRWQQWQETMLTGPPPAHRSPWDFRLPALWLDHLYIMSKPFGSLFFCYYLSSGGKISLKLTTHPRMCVRAYTSCASVTR